jgi:predicted lipoprotein with Yx(FWY)xxD motif
MNPPWLRRDVQNPCKDVIMAKLTLNLEHLRVETFATETRRVQKGTVLGAQISAYTGCTCPAYTEDEGCSVECSDTCLLTNWESCRRCPHEH